MGRTAYSWRSDRAALYARDVLPPLENRDPGDETVEDDD
jgi:hypothetical protein